jgi:hypothetical protein
MMLLVLILGGALGWIAHRARVQREAVAAIVRAGGDVYYDGEWGSVRLRPRGPDWLRGFLGRDYFDTVVSVSGDTPETDDAVVAQIGRLAQVHQLMLQGSSVTDAGLAALSGMHELRTLHLNMPNVHGPGLRHLSGLHNIKNLHLYRTPISDESLAYLVPLTAIERLSFSSPRIGDAGMTHVAKLPGLKLLSIGRSDVGDEGLRELGRIRRSIQVEVRPGTRITPGGIDAMEALDPEMKITPGR